MGLDGLRGEFPVLARLAYLNAGTDGPIPERGQRAAAARARIELERGRSGVAHRRELGELYEALRGRLFVAPRLRRRRGGAHALDH